MPSTCWLFIKCFVLRSKEIDHFTEGPPFLLQNELYLCIQFFAKGLGMEDKAPRHEFERDNKELNDFVSRDINFWMVGEKKVEMGPGREDRNMDWKHIAGTS